MLSTHTYVAIAYTHRMLHNVISRVIYHIVRTFSHDANFSAFHACADFVKIKTAELLNRCIFELAWSIKK